MKYRYLVIEVSGNWINHLKVVGRYATSKIAFEVRDSLKEQSVSSSYMVSVILDD